MLGGAELPAVPLRPEVPPAMDHPRRREPQEQRQGGAATPPGSVRRSGKWRRPARAGLQVAAFVKQLGSNPVGGLRSLCPASNTASKRRQDWPLPTYSRRRPRRRPCCVAPRSPRARVSNAAAMDLALLAQTHKDRGMDTKNPKQAGRNKRRKPDFRCDPKDLHAEDGFADLLPSDDATARLPRHAGTSRATRPASRHPSELRSMLPFDRHHRADPRGSTNPSSPRVRGSRCASRLDRSSRAAVFPHEMRALGSARDWHSPVAAVLCRHRPEDCGCHPEPDHRRACPRCNGTLGGDA